MSIFDEQRRCFPLIDKEFANPVTEHAYENYLTQQGKEQKFAVNGAIGAFVMSLTMTVVTGVYYLLHEFAQEQLCHLLFVYRYNIPNFRLVRDRVSSESCDDLVERSDQSELPLFIFAVTTALDLAVMLVLIRFGDRSATMGCMSLSLFTHCCLCLAWRSPNRCANTWTTTVGMLHDVHPSHARSMYHVHRHNFLDVVYFLPFLVLVYVAWQSFIVPNTKVMMYNIVGVFMAWWGVTALRNLSDRVERSRFVVSHLSGTFRARVQEECDAIRAVLECTIPSVIAAEVIENVRKTLGGSGRCCAHCSTGPALGLLIPQQQQQRGGQSFRGRWS